MAATDTSAALEKSADAILADDETTIASLGAMTFSDSSKVTDKAKLKRSFERFVTGFKDLLDAESALRKAQSAMGVLLMAVRSSIELDEGRIDYFGSSACYRKLFDDLIVPTIMSTYEVKESEAKRLLNLVRVNYISRNELVKQEIVAQAIKSGAVEEDVAKEYADKVKSTPGGAAKVVSNAEIIPAPLKAIIEQEYAAQYPTKAGKTPEQANPYREKTSPARTADAEDKVADPKEALRMIEQGLSAIAQASPDTLGVELHRICTAVSDHYLGAPGEKSSASFPGGKEKVIKWLQVSEQLLHETGAAIAGQAKKADVAPLRWSGDLEQV